VSVYVGVMSGTSLDGVDVAIVSFAGEEERPTTVEPLAFRSDPWEPELRGRIREAIETGSAERICELNFELGRRIGGAVLDALDAAGIEPSRVRAIGSHGQTVWHVPPRAGRPGSTLQLGSPPVIAELTGIDVVSDFRARDMAAGGHGAPLTAYTDDLLFRGVAPRVIQNIGGMANLTWLPPLDDPRSPVAFDTGPGVALIDGAVRRRTDEALAFDADGRLAAAGSPVDEALAEWLSDPYFAAPPPKSTGREHFSEGRLAAWLDRHRERSTPDLVATLAELTARTVADGIRSLATPPAACFLCGGGARNPWLVARITDLLAPVPVGDLSELGMDPDAREAIAFALLARQHGLGIPANAPWATGAEGPRILGSRTMA